MQRIKYQRPVAPIGDPRDPVRLPMQSKQFVTNGFAPSPAKPKLWGSTTTGTLDVCRE
jgi:hypothetical protein